MRTQQNNFVSHDRIGARYFGNDVVAVGVGAVVPGLDVDAQLDGRTGAQSVHQHVVLLRRHDQRWHRIVCGAQARAQHEHGAFVALRGSQHGRRSGIAQHLGQYVARQWTRGVVRAWRANRHWLIICRGLQTIFGDEEVLRFGRQHDGAAQFTDMRLYGVGVGVVADIDRLRHHLARHRRRPRFRVGNERHVARRCELDGLRLERPSATKRERFEMHTRESVLPKLLCRPVNGLLERRRAGEPWPDHVREVIEQHLHLRAVESLVADARERGIVLRPRRRCVSRCAEEQGRNISRHRSLRSRSQCR